MDFTGVHYLSGPFEIEGAQPGDLLLVEIMDVQPFQDRPWGFTGIFDRRNGVRLPPFFFSFSPLTAENDGMLTGNTGRLPGRDLPLGVRPFPSPRPHTSFLVVQQYMCAY